MSSELLTRLQMADQGSEPGEAEGQQPDSMQCSSAECSPAPTPQRGSACLTPSAGNKATLLPSALKPRLPPGSGGPQPQSPSDPQLEGVDLRKATLMRMMVLRAAGEDVDMQQCSPARPLRRPLPNLFAAALPPMKPLSGLASSSNTGTDWQQQTRESSASPRSMEASPAAQLQPGGSADTAAAGLQDEEGFAGIPFRLSQPEQGEGGAGWVPLHHHPT